MIAAVEAGWCVVPAIHGRPVADIVPRQERSERRSSELLLADLAAIGKLAQELGIRFESADFDVGLSTDDMGAGASDA